MYYTSGRNADNVLFMVWGIWIGDWISALERMTSSSQYSVNIA
jgi:hypothetical protein